MSQRIKFLLTGLIAGSLLFAGIASAQTDPYRDLLDQVGSTDLYKDANVAVVFDSTITLVENTGLSHVVNHSLLKVLSWEGARRFTALRFDYDPASNVLEPRQVIVHRADGSLETVDLSTVLDQPQPQSMIYWGARMQVLPLPRLNVGDALEIETYKKGFQIAYLESELTPDEERYIPPMRGHFYDVVTFQGDDPIREKVYVLRLSRDKPAQYAVYNGEVFSALTLDDTLLVYTFWKKDVPVMKHEPRQPGATDIVPKVVLATVKDWPEKSRWFFQVNDTVFAADADVRAQANDIVRGLKTDDEKIAAVLHWTAQNIRYSGITMGKGEGYTLHPGIMTLHDRCGVCKDIAGMSITLLRALGFTVYPTMTMAGARVERIPADQFNHCVVAIKRPDGSFTMIDPTWAPYGMENWCMAEGEQHIVIGSPEGEDLTAIRTFTAEENRTNLALKGSLNENGDLEGTLTIDATGYGDTRLRRAIAYTVKQNQSRLFADWVSRLASDAEVLQSNYTDLADLSKPARLEIRFRAPGYALKAGPNLFYSPAAVKVAQASPRAFQLVSDLTSDERHNLLMIWNPRLVTITETITVPKGFSLAQTPETNEKSEKIASCTTRISLEKGFLTSRLEYRLNHRTIPPEDYKPVKEAYDTLKNFAQDVWQIKKGS